MKEVWYSPASVWQHKSTIIAAFSIVAILSHLGLRYGFHSPAGTYQIPLLVTLILGGLPLLYDLLRKILKREFGSDLLGGISIITSIVLGEYLAGSIIVLMLAGGEALESYALRSASSVLGLVLGEKAVSGELYGELSGYMGPSSAGAIESMVQSASKPTQGVVATVSGLMMLIVGASGVFGELKEALNTIWGVKSKPGGGIRGLLRGQFLNFGMVLVIGFLLLVSLVMSTAIAGLNQRLENVLPLPAIVWAAVAFVISLGLVTTLFALIFKVLPDAQIRWRHVWFGALITALLFEVGKTGLSWYLGREGTASAFGAAGSVVLLLLWVYYTSAILFFGAEFTQVYADAEDCAHHGCGQCAARDRGQACVTGTDR